MSKTKAALLLCSLWLALCWPASHLLAYRDLETGTFLTRDPAGFVDGPNLYAYVRQNPWTHFDPEGLWQELGDTPGQFKVVRGADGSISASGSMMIQTGPGLLNAYNAVPNPAEVAAYNFAVTGNVRYLENNPAIKAGEMNAAVRGLNDPRGESEMLSGIVGGVLSFGSGPRMAETIKPMGPGGKSARTVIERNQETIGTSRQLTEQEQILYRRVPLRKGARDEIFDRSRSVDGTVYDPYSGRPISENEPWDAGHKPEYKLEHAKRDAARRGLTRKEWMEEQSNPNLYRAERRIINQSHIAEGPESSFRTGSPSQPGPHVEDYEPVQRK